MKTTFLCFHLFYVPSAVGNHSEVRDNTTLTIFTGTCHYLVRQLTSSFSSSTSSSDKSSCSFTFPSCMMRLMSTVIKFIRMYWCFCSSMQKVIYIYHVILLILQINILWMTNLIPLLINIHQLKVVLLQPSVHKLHLLPILGNNMHIHQQLQTPCGT